MKIVPALDCTGPALPNPTAPLAAPGPPSHKQPMPELFDRRLRSLRRDRASRTGPALFLFERTFDDILDRLALVRRNFTSALLIGVPDPSWPDRLRRIALHVDAVDPGRLFSTAAGGERMDEEALEVEPESIDLCVAIGTLDTANSLPDALLRIRFALHPGGLLIGAMAGGDTLPRLRVAMRAADSATGAASPHTHPRIEAAALAHLLSAAGFRDSVVDVDRIQLNYGSFSALVDDLRAMGATNILSSRSRKPLGRASLAAARRSFEEQAVDGKTIETVEILHFAAWAPERNSQG